MEIIVGKNSGFCAGVRHTITKTEEELKKNSIGIDCLGEIIHNKQVVQNLESQGLRIIDSIEKAKDKVIIRAHGISKEIYEIAKNNNIDIIDLTCPKVLKIHEMAEAFSRNNYFIFLFGIKDHPETIGTFSFCGKNSCLIENKDDLSSALDIFKKSGLKNLLIISQTTFSVLLFEEMKDIVLNTLDNHFNIRIEKSICNATDVRQQEASEISSQVDLMIIIGGKNSSNTKKLYEISKTHLNNVLHIETKNDLDLDFVKNFNTVGIIAGASTPDYVINDVISCLQDF